MIKIKWKKADLSKLIYGTNIILTPFYPIYTFFLLFTQNDQHLYRFLIYHTTTTTPNSHLFSIFVLLSCACLPHFFKNKKNCINVLCITCDSTLTTKIQYRSMSTLDLFTYGTHFSGEQFAIYFIQCLLVRTYHQCVCVS